MEQKLISIVIPVYNAEDFLDDCFKSLSIQTYRNLEIIFVDDGSTDNSYRKCLEYADKDCRVKVYKKKNGGQNSARKLGVENAEGEYIGFVDADDWVDSAMYEKMFNNLNEHSADIVICGMNKVDMDGKINPQTPVFSGICEGMYVLERVFEESNLFKTGIPVALFTTLMSKAVLRESMYIIDERIDFSEDYAWLTVACLNSSRIYVMQETFCFHRRHEKSVTGVHNKNNLVSQKLLYKNILKIFTQRNASKEAYKQLGYVIIYSMLIGGYDYFLKKYSKLFPYNVHRGAKIVLYGAGKCGTEIYAKVKEDEAFDIVAWVDKNWQMYNSNSILPIEKIREFEFDYIVIAIMTLSVSRLVKSNLASMGIEEQKIRIMDLSLIEDEVAVWMK